MNKNVHWSLKALMILTITAAGFIRAAEMSPAPSQEQEEKDKGLFELLEKGAPVGIFKDLFKKGANPNARHGESGELILSHVVRLARKSFEDPQRVSELIEIVNLLLQNGANPNLTDAQGRTPLGWALTSDKLGLTSHEELLNTFIEHGADVNKKFFHGNVEDPFLARLIFMGLLTSAKKAIEAGADVGISLDYISDVPLKGAEKDKVRIRRHYTKLLEEIHADVLKEGVLQQRQFEIERAIEESTELPEDVSRLIAETVVTGRPLHPAVRQSFKRRKGE